MMISILSLFLIFIPAVAVQKSAPFLTSPPTKNCLLQIGDSLTQGSSHYPRNWRFRLWKKLIQNGTTDNNGVRVVLDPSNLVYLGSRTMHVDKRYSWFLNVPDEAEGRSTRSGLSKKRSAEAQRYYNQSHMLGLWYREDDSTSTTPRTTGASGETTTSFPLPRWLSFPRFHEGHGSWKINDMLSSAFRNPGHVSWDPLFGDVHDPRAVADWADTVWVKRTSQCRKICVLLFLGTNDILWGHDPPEQMIFELIELM